MLRLALLACLSVLALPVSAQQASEPAQKAADLQRADVDDRINAGVRMASDSQAYYLKPHDFGGGEGSFDGLSLTAIEYPVNEAGRYVRLSGDGGGTQTYTLDHRDGVVTIEAVSDRYDPVVRVVVSGPTVNDISVKIVRP